MWFMHFSEDIIHEVIALNDIVNVVAGYITLNQRGSNHFGICPFHNEKSASFSVNQSGQFFNCFGCNVGGNVITFMMMIENLSFIDAVKLLADRANFKLPEKEETHDAKQKRESRELAAELNKQAARFYHDYLYSDSADAKKALEYLRQRGIHHALAKRFGMGLSPPEWDGLIKHCSTVLPEHLAAAGLAVQNKNDATRYYDRFRARLMFPIIDSRGRVVGFGGRIMGDSDGAKYLNTSDTHLFKKSDQLYGLNLARKSRKSEYIVVEGYMDVIAMHQWGFVNTVGVLGTALTDSHARLLKNAGCTSVVLMLDGDEAGIRATMRAIPALEKASIKIRTLNISEHDKDAKDPDEYLKKRGSSQLTELLKSAKSHIYFQLQLLQKKYDMQTTDGRIDFVKNAAKLLALLPSQIEIEAYVSEFVKTSDFTAQTIYAEINKEKGITQTTLPIQMRRTYRQKNEQNSGVINAKKALLNLVLMHPVAAKALEESKCITSSEMGNGIYDALLQLAYTNAENNKIMTPAEIIASFETSEAHQEIAAIFVDSLEYSTKAAVEKTLNETVAIIKRAWAISEMENAQNTPETLQTLGLLIRNIPPISI